MKFNKQISFSNNKSVYSTKTIVIRTKKMKFVLKRSNNSSLFHTVTYLLCRYLRY